MSEEAIKRQKRRLIESVQRYFCMTSDVMLTLNGRPFDLEFCDGHQTWKIRCVAGTVSDSDREAVKSCPLPSYFRKAIACHAAPGSKKDFDLIRIE
jgi:hypothetical protein